jgi:hypothetical protein
MRGGRPILFWPRAILLTNLGWFGHPITEKTKKICSMVLAIGGGQTDWPTDTKTDVPSVMRIETQVLKNKVFKTQIQKMSGISEKGVKCN